MRKAKTHRLSGLGSGSGSSSGKSSLDETGKPMNKVSPKLEKLESFALSDAGDSSESDSTSSRSSSEDRSFHSAYPRAMGKWRAEGKVSRSNDGGGNITNDDIDALKQLSAKHVIADGNLTGGNIKELSILRLTYQTLRKVFQGADAISSTKDSADDEKNNLIQNTVAVLHVTDRMIKEDRPATGETTNSSVNALSAQAREYLFQYNTGFSAQSIEKSIQLAKSAYETMIAHDALFETVTTTRQSMDGEGLMRTSSGSSVHMRNGSISRSKNDPFGRDFFNVGRLNSTSRRDSLSRTSSGSIRSDVVGGNGWGGGDIGSLAGVTLKMFSAIDDWESFDALVFEQELKAESRNSRGILTTTIDVVLRRFDILEDLHLSKTNFYKFTASLEAKYGQPDYHTAAHAADVVQAVGFMLAEGLYDQISPLQALVLLVAAAAHDVGHPGYNNAFLISTESEEALRWNEVSVNENGHLHIALGLLRRYKVLDSLTPDDVKSFKTMLRRLILGTDMEKHTQMVTDFVAMATATMAAANGDTESCDDEVDNGSTPADSLSAATLAGVPVRDWEDPILALCYVLHCADISNPARPFPVAKKWGEKITEEFYKQGDKERALGMRVLAFCDRTVASGPAVVAQNQGNFIDFVCKPTFEALSTVLPVAADLMLYHLGKNRDEYRKLSSAKK